MELSNPISSVIPSAHGAVLAVLAHADTPLSGRQIAVLAQGQVQQSRANDVLRELTQAGIVSCERHASVHLYRLNRDHVAAEAIMILVNLRERLIQRMREAVLGWVIAPVAVWMFGSAARGDAGSHSDIDVLVVRREAVDVDNELWQQQLSDLSSAVTTWSGNDCQILEFSRSELAVLVASDERLVAELRSDALVIAGTSPLRLLGRVRVG
ncbi:MAG: nucleotidyltransferase domain-containing protein [Ilumatobacteraceae bacterium]